MRRHDSVPMMPMQKEGEDEEIEIEYVSAPVDFGPESSKQDDEEDERPGLGGLGFGMGGLGFPEPKVC